MEHAGLFQRRTGNVDGDHNEGAGTADFSELFRAFFT